MSAAEEVDLLILGAGSTAFAAALRAQELGKSVLMTEERTVGGTCANRGCLPSKNLIEAARLVHEAAHPRFAGIEPARLSFDFRTLVAQKDDLVRDYRAKKYESLLGGGLEIASGHAELVDASTVEVGDRRIRGRAILIATGSRPVVPKVQGLEKVRYLTSDLLTAGEREELTELPSSLLILGGGYIALELGQMFRRFGAQVTIVERGAELLSRGYEPELGPVVREILEAEGVRVLRGASVVAMVARGEGAAAFVEHAFGRETVQAERVLVACGRRPNTDRVGLQRAGVRVGAQGQIEVDQHLRTNVPHIFAAGDVIGTGQGAQMATPVGSRDGGIAADNALAPDRPRAVDHRVVPRAIFTDPPIAMVGMTEREVLAAGRPCWCRTLPMSLVPRAGAIRDMRGIVKMVADASTGEVLGVAMVGQGAAEVIHEAAMGLRFRARLDDFVELLHVYPAMAEALKVAAISRHKDPAKLSCCAE